MCARSQLALNEVKIHIQIKIIHLHHVPARIHHRSANFSRAENIFIYTPLYVYTPPPKTIKINRNGKKRARSFPAITSLVPLHWW